MQNKERKHNIFRETKEEFIVPQLHLFQGPQCPGQLRTNDTQHTY